MHLEAQTFITAHAHAIFGPRTPIDVLEIGSLDVNGGLRHLYPKAHWLGLDYMPGPGVDVVADARTWRTDVVFDLVICAEVLEHCPQWWEIIATAGALVRPGGAFICTAATWPRAHHGAYDPDGTYGVLPGEHYENVDVAALLSNLDLAEFKAIDMVVDRKRGDVYVCARP